MVGVGWVGMRWMDGLGSVEDVLDWVRFSCVAARCNVKYSPRPSTMHHWLQIVCDR